VQGEHADVETAEVEDLDHARVGQQALEVGAVVPRPAELDQVRVAAAVGELNKAEVVAPEA
jgi:hypothetical protein